MHAAPVFGSQQENSKELHEDYVAKELRRKDAVYYSPEFVGAEKFLFTTLSSGELGLQGNVDCIIKTAKGEFVPVEYKNMSSDDGRVCMDHKYQLVADALLIEENFGTIVKRGFVNYIMDSQHDRGQYDCCAGLGKIINARRKIAYGCDFQSLRGECQKPSIFSPHSDGFRTVIISFKK